MSKKISCWRVEYDNSISPKFVTKIVFRYSGHNWSINKHVGNIYRLKNNGAIRNFSIYEKVINETTPTELKYRLQKSLNLYDKLSSLTTTYYISAIIDRIFYKLSGLTTKEIGLLNRYNNDLKSVLPESYINNQPIKK